MNCSLRSCIILVTIFMLYSGCSKSLIREPVAVSSGRWQMTLEGLTLGPDQYNTAGGYWEPRKGKRFIWATVRIRNIMKTDQVVLLDKILLTAGGKQVKPFILDMNSPVTMRANPEPRLAPGETISRRLIYIIPESVAPEKIIYEKTEIGFPGIK
jgi:hypothetical protein